MLLCGSVWTSLTLAAQMEALYEAGSDEDEGSDDEDSSLTRPPPASFDSDDDEDDEGAPPLTREDFDGILDDFLTRHEVYGGRLRTRLGAPESSGAAKLGQLREELGAPLARRRDEVDEGEESEESEEEEIMMPRSARDGREKWDVETVLCEGCCAVQLYVLHADDTPSATRSNLENHPRLIAARSSVAGSTMSHRPTTIASSGIGRPSSLSTNGSEVMPRVRINPRTGLPEITSYIKLAAPRERELPPTGFKEECSSVREVPEEDEDEAYSSGGESDDTIGARRTITRPRNESAEEKKARKTAAKESKQVRLPRFLPLLSLLTDSPLLRRHVRARSRPASRRTPRSARRSSSRPAHVSREAVRPMWAAMASGARASLSDLLEGRGAIVIIRTATLARGMVLGLG